MKDNKSNNVETQDELTQSVNFNSMLSAYIMATLDIEQNFKLYSFRIITPEVFVKRFDELQTILQQAKDKLK